MKHGVLYEAIKRRGWTLAQASEFLGISTNSLCRVINLKQNPPFIFSSSMNEKTKLKARELTEKLMELTSMTVDDLFPEAFRTNEFLAKPKLFERTADVPVDKLVGYAETLALPPAPDEELIEKEDNEEVLNVLSGLSFQQQHAVKRVLFEGKETHEAAEERGVSQSAISANLQMAKKKIREELGRRRQRERLGVLRKVV